MESYPHEFGQQILFYNHDVSAGEYSSQIRKEVGVGTGGYDRLVQVLFDAETYHLLFCNSWQEIQSCCSELDSVCPGLSLLGSCSKKYNRLLAVKFIKSRQ